MWEPEKFYGSRRHPPQLTRTERHRFIRGYYQIWGLMKLDESEWDSRLEPMKLKRLYQLCEMSKLRQPVGFKEEGAYGDGTRFPMGFHRSLKREALNNVIWARIISIYQEVHNQIPDHPWMMRESGGCYDSVLIWDHWQQGMEDLIGRVSRATPWRPEMKELLWEDTSDEEIG
jgi:hypothetical protein